jgi:hypothetical protein
MPPGLVNRGAGVGIGTANRATITTSYDVFDEEGNLIGYLTDISRTDTRTVERIRHLSSHDAGRTIEQAPGPDDISLTCTGFALYNKTDQNGELPHFSLASRLGGLTGAELFKSLNSQRVAFNIRVEEVHPATGAVSRTYYFGCMLTNYTKPISLGNITVAETANVQVAVVDSLGTASESSPGTVVGA